MQRTQLTVAFLLGMVVALTGALVATAGRSVIPEARAQGANQDMLVVAGNGGQQQNRDTVFVIDSKSTRMAIYQLNNGRLSLLAIRNMMYDLKYEEYSNPSGGGKQSPAVKEVAAEVQKK
jgi:hypothetical protein